MKKRLLFILVYILCFPLAIVIFFPIAFVRLFISPVVWILTGDVEKSFDVTQSRIQTWVLELPFKITKTDY